MPSVVNLLRFSCILGVSWGTLGWLFHHEYRVTNTSGAPRAGPSSVISVSSCKLPRVWGSSAHELQITSHAPRISPPILRCPIFCASCASLRPISVLSCKTALFLSSPYIELRASDIESRLPLFDFAPFEPFCGQPPTSAVRPPSSGLARLRRDPSSVFSHHQPFTRIACIAILQREISKISSSAIGATPVSIPVTKACSASRWPF